jgi:hypothetical protein
MTAEEIQREPHAEVEAALPSEHPSSYYTYAIRLVEEERRDDGVFWFYAGQLRYRFHLAAHPDLAPDGDPAVMASLNATIGTAINAYAGSKPEAWTAQIDRVLAWDAETENDFTSKEKHEERWQETRSGLASLRDMIAQNADTIRQEREKSGLQRER